MSSSKDIESSHLRKESIKKIDKEDKEEEYKPNYLINSSNVI
jgi:hypothetical protein